VHRAKCCSADKLDYSLLTFAGQSVLDHCVILPAPGWRAHPIGGMCGRRVRGFAIDLIPELVRTGCA
jgi:hypothetical protein